MKLFVWDFHGVLERGNELAVREISNFVLREAGFKEQLDEKENLQLYGKKWWEYFAFKLPQESQETHLRLQNACYIYSQNHPEIREKYLRPNHHAKTVVARIAKKHDQIILSNSDPAFLKHFIHLAQLEKYFPEGKFFGMNNHREGRVRSKSEFLKEYITNRGVDRLVCIGDSPEDIQLASVFPHSTTYLYTHPGKEFKEIAADYKVSDLREVLREL